MGYNLSVSTLFLNLVLTIIDNLVKGEKIVSFTHQR